MSARERASWGEARRWLAAFLAAPEQTDDCILWPFSQRGHGYGVTARNKGVHVVVCEHFHGPRPDGMDACHSHTGNRHCINPRHLRWDTRAANVADAIAHGTVARGERNGHAKLTEAQVTEMRERYKGGGISQRALAREYEVSQSTVKDILAGRRWGWAL